MMPVTLSEANVSQRRMERATTIPKGSTLKRVEARGIRKGEDIVSSAWKHAAVFN